MEDKLKRAFMHLKLECGSELADQTWHIIASKQKRSVQTKFWAFACLAVGSLAALVPSFIYLSRGLADSGFYDYFSLIFSDSGTVTSHATEFSFALADALPYVSLLLFMLLLFMFFASLRWSTREFISKSRLSF